MVPFQITSGFIIILIDIGTKLFNVLALFALKALSLLSDGSASWYCDRMWHKSHVLPLFQTLHSSRVDMSPEQTAHRLMSSGKHSSFCHQLITFIIRKVKWTLSVTLPGVVISRSCCLVFGYNRYINSGDTVNDSCNLCTPGAGYMEHT